MIKQVCWLAISTLFILGCSSSELPTQRYSQFSLSNSHSYADNQLKINLSNPLHCPLRMWVSNADTALRSRLNELNPIILSARTDSTISLNQVVDFNDKLSYGATLGSTKTEIKPFKLSLPFPAGKEYRLIQGNDTDHTHSGSWSKYALDFALAIGDTITAAADGYVVGLIEEYSLGGEGDKWRPYGNFLTLYHPESGVFTQYVHLRYKGGLVKPGDAVKSGQPIALSGMTGQTDIAHLHFNCLVPVNTNAGLKSIPYEFIEGYKSVEMKKNDVIKKSNH